MNLTEFPTRMWLALLSCSSVEPPLDSSCLLRILARALPSPCSRTMARTPASSQLDIERHPCGVVEKPRPLCHVKGRGFDVLAVFACQVFCHRVR